MDVSFNEGEEVLLSNWIYEQKTHTQKDKSDSVQAAKNSP